jgi:hypothetical protein
MEVLNMSDIIKTYVDKIQNQNESIFPIDSLHTTRVVQKQYPEKNDKCKDNNCKLK